MESDSDAEVTEEQRRRAEANRLAALEKRKRAAESATTAQTVTLRHFKCQKILSVPTPVEKSLPPPPPPPPPIGFRAVFEICSPDEFSVSPEPLDGLRFPGESECLRVIENSLFSAVPFSTTQTQNGRISSIFKLANHDQVSKSLKKIPNIKLHDIPYRTRTVVQKFSSFTEDHWTPLLEDHNSNEQVEELLAKLPISLRDSLLPFQLEGVKYGLRRGGRCLIADEMGLGKTLQAIAIACCYSDEGPILIVCPAVLRYSWAEELERWLPTFLPNDIHLVFGHQNSLDYLEHCPKVVIISYRMLSRLKRSMIDKKWGLLIVDESHNIRCTKKKTERDETKTILELATKIKHIVLLSGTPSLTRPYDIYHQINILWPQLLGKDKYEFAKNYCALRAVKGPQGIFYQDFSKGIRLSELNVLLKQTLMIRRLKEHVLSQLPPKRRQIIRLRLKSTDIQLANNACKERRSQICYSQNPNPQLANSDQPEPQGDEGCKKSLKNLAPQVIGIAKLSGFTDWFSSHCIAGEEEPDCDADVDVDVDVKPCLQKTIIFAHHLKVLDGIQACMSSNGIKLVRIDGSTTPRERQDAVESFRSSPEVKVAVIGITAGGVGLDFSTARNVVFLELPKTSSDMLQAEDRAHRRGQKNAINIYIFCAKGTPDEYHWLQLNRNLFSVSSVMNGKKDAVPEFEVDDVYSFSKSTDNQTQIEDLNSTAKQTTGGSRLQIVEESEARGTEEKERDEDFLIRTVPFQVMGNKDNDSDLQRTTSMSINVENNGSVISLDSRSSCVSKKSTKIIVSQASNNNPNESAEFLLFEVSQHTGRIHLYTCIPGQDTRPRPLFENFRPEELETSKKDSRIHNALKKFLSEWGNLRPIERNKLLGKPLQLPLTVELCYLKESTNTNHSSQGLLKGGSKRRVTPLTDISKPLPENAEWKKVTLRGIEKREYAQAWIFNSEQPLCKLCQDPCNGKLAKTPEYFEDLFCKLSCFQEYRIRTSQRALRQALFEIEHGVCDICKLDCSALVKCLKPLSVRRRIEYISKFAPNIAAKKKLTSKLANEPNEGNSWHADHRIAVYNGGGECSLENLRTLCVACHQEVTKSQCQERKLIKRRAKELLKNANKKVEEDRETDDLLVAVPGSSYSVKQTQVSDYKNDEMLLS